MGRREIVFAEKNLKTVKNYCLVKTKDINGQWHLLFRAALGGHILPPPLCLGVSRKCYDKGNFRDDEVS